MSKFRWSLAGLMSVLLFVALAAAGYRAFWSDQHPNASLLVGIDLALVCTATLGAWRGRPVLRRPCLGYALFGWSHLAVVLQLGWRLETIYDAQRIAEQVQSGILLAVLCAIAALWIIPPQADSRTPG